MFKVIEDVVNRDRCTYKTGNVLKAGTPVYAIELDRAKGHKRYFTFSYTTREYAEAIARKLWKDSNFKQEANRTDNVQFTLVSDRGPGDD